MNRNELFSLLMLREKGAKEGDTISINDMEFDFVE